MTSVRMLGVANSRKLQSSGYDFVVPPFPGFPCFANSFGQVVHEGARAMRCSLRDMESTHREKMSSITRRELSALKKLDDNEVVSSYVRDGWEFFVVHNTTRSIISLFYDEMQAAKLAAKLDGIYGDCDSDYVKKSLYRMSGCSTYAVTWSRFEIGCYLGDHQLVQSFLDSSDDVESLLTERTLEGRTKLDLAAASGCPVTFGAISKASQKTLGWPLLSTVVVTDIRTIPIGSVPPNGYQVIHSRHVKLSHNVIAVSYGKLGEVWTFVNNFGVFTSLVHVPEEWRVIACISDLYFAIREIVVEEKYLEKR